LKALLLAVWLALAATLFSGVAAAQPANDKTAPQAASTARAAAKAPDSFWGIVFSGGPVGITIMICLFAVSIAAVALMIEQSITLRGPVLMPPGVGEQVRNHLSAGQLASATAVCQQQPSFLSFVIQAGLSEVEGGWDAVEKAAEDALAEQAARLTRKVEYLSVLANIGPMLGLLGTVTGLIMAFKEVADTQGTARPAELAQGIYSALVTTVAGLIIAIPCLGVLAVLRNRLDELVAETAYAAQHALAPLKRLGRRAARPPAAAPAPPPVKANPT
jgi:biopolymer transport protein ExbB